MIMGNRMSLLPISRHCGQAATLSSQHGAGRAAAMSTAFHARCAGAANAGDLLKALTKQELEEVLLWAPPVDVVVGEGSVLTYASAYKEVAVALDEWGMPADPAGPSLSLGHLDFAWVVLGDSSGDAAIAYVADIKKSIWTSVDDPKDSLQLHAYAQAFAQQKGCGAYCVGFWIATEKEWQWSPEVVWLGSPTSDAIMSQILFAASNVGGSFATGPHCRHCWSRLHCPEYVLPASLADSWLAPVSSGVVPTDEEATALKAKLDTIREVAEAADKQLRELVRHGKVSVVEGGKKWVPCETKGKESVDREKLELELGEKSLRYIKRGRNFEQFRWIKA